MNWQRVAVGATVGLLALWAFRKRSPTNVVPGATYSKGVFIEFGLYADPAEELRRAGFDFVIIQTAVQKKSKEDFIWRNSGKLNNLIRRLNPPGVRPLGIWLWGWPIPSRYKEYVPHVEDVLENTPAAGYVLNIEAKAWSLKKFGPQLETVADDFITKLRAVTDKPLYVSSHGRADYAPLPWKALSRLDGGMPQAYDSKNQYGDPFIEKCIRSYQEKGFKTVWPTLGAVKTDAKRMEEQLGQLPPCVDALTWWTWTSIGRSDNRKIVTAGAGDPCPQHVA